MHYTCGASAAVHHLRGITCVTCDRCNERGFRAGGLPKWANPMSTLQVPGAVMVGEDLPDGTFHCMWDDSHKDIGDVAARTAGEL